MIGRRIFIILSTITLLNVAKGQLNGLLTSVLTSVNHSQRCSNAIEYMVEMSNTNPELMMRYFDSWGTASHAIFEGFIFHPGSYQQCVDLDFPQLGKMDYCYFPMKLNLSLDQIVIPSLSLQTGVCYPSQCTAHEFASIIKTSEFTSLYRLSYASTALSYRKNYVLDTQGTFNCPQLDIGYDTGTVVVIVLMSTLAGVITIASMMDIVKQFYQHVKHPPLRKDKDYSESNGNTKQDDQIGGYKAIHDQNEPEAEQLKEFVRSSKVDKLLAAMHQFSIYNAATRLFTNKFDADKDIGCLGGMRVITMFFMLAGYLPYVALTYYGIHNLYFATVLMQKKFLFLPGVVSIYFFHSFYTLNGLTIAYVAFKDIEKNKGKFSIVRFYLRYIIHVVPVYYVTLFLYYKLFLRTDIGGPNWHIPQRNCDKYWWTHLLFINNFYPKNSFDQCYYIGFYNAADMQCTLVAPIFIWLLYKNWRIGATLILAVVIGCSTAAGVLTGTENYNAYLVYSSHLMEQFRDFYVKPWFKFSGYAIGMLYGYILFRKWTPNWSSRVKYVFYCILWIVSGFFLTISIFGVYKEAHDKEFSKFEHIMFITFTFPAWSLGVATVVYICHTGYGGSANALLSGAFWNVPSKLTFEAITCCELVAGFLYATSRFPQHLDAFLGLAFYLALEFCSYFVAMALALLVEIPFSNFGRFLMSSKKQASSSDITL